MSEVQTLKAVAQSFIGRTCTGFVAGEGTGSHLSLEFEPRVERKSPLRNPHLTPEQRQTEARYSVLVLCSWRLDSPDEVICGGWDDNSLGGAMLSGLKQLVGRRLTALDISRPGSDANLDFDGLTLRIFCDQVNTGDAEDNYILFAPETIFTVSTRSALHVEARDAGGTKRSTIRGVPSPRTR